MNTMNKSEAVASFQEHYLFRFGDDKIAIYRGWHDYLDGLVKDNQITHAQEERWSAPEFTELQIARAEIAFLKGKIDHLEENTRC